MVTMHRPLLLYDSTKTDSDVRYLIGTSVPDAIAIVSDGGETTALVSALEIGRLQHTSPAVRLVPIDGPDRPEGSGNGKTVDGLCRFLRGLGLNSVGVKETFPISLADGLRARGIEITVADFSILPQRLVKSNREISEIRRAIEIVKTAFETVERILGDAKIGGHGELINGNGVLTADSLRTTIEMTCYQLGGIAEDTIVAGGIDACDPHGIGHGPLMANEFIVVDIFPRLRDSGYHADVSRTFFKGNPTAEQGRMYDAVKCAHDAAIDRAHAGVPVATLMAATLEFFEGRGFRSSRVASPPHGMFHSLGHGFGLDVHEPPTIGNGDGILRAGMVVTVEPGLYYRQIGGVRIEDDILVGENSSEILTKIPYDWAIG
jgi:Xaa-Pro aminopeptidase